MNSRRCWSKGGEIISAGGGWSRRAAGRECFSISRGSSNRSGPSSNGRIETTDGSLADLPATPDPSVWERVCAEHGNCLGKKCQFYKDCFWQSAKRRMNSGNILVVNHALFFSDLALRISGVNYLPKYDVVILDEAHTIEDVAASHFGLNVSEHRLRYQLRTLYDPKRGKGLLSTHGAVHQRCDRCHRGNSPAAWTGFSSTASEWQRQHGRDNGRVHEPGIVENNLTPALRELSLHLKAMLATIRESGGDFRDAGDGGKGEPAGEELDALVSQRMPDAVYWMELGGRRGGMSACMRRR